MEKTIDLNVVLNNEQKYNNIVSELEELILTKSFKTRKEKIKVTVGSDTINMSYGRLLVNLLMYNIIPSVCKKFNIELSKEDLILDKHFTADVQSRINNNIIKICGEAGVDYSICSKEIGNTINLVSDLFAKAAHKYGASPVLLDFLELERDNKDARRFMNIQLQQNLQFDEVENVFKSVKSLLSTCMSKHPEVGMHHYINAESGVNMKQFTQSFGMIGLKPDLDGTIIKHAVETSYYHGMTSDLDHFIDCKGTRKALIVNATMVSVAGYLNQKLTLLLMDTLLTDENNDDCHSKHPIIYDIDSEAKLKLVDDRYYYNIADTGEIDFNHLNYIDTSDKKTFLLVGKKIALRTPETCACKGDKVCSICYGKKLHAVNKDIHAGIYAVLCLMDILTQRLLSAKHLLTTNAQRIEWPDVIKNNFSISFDSLTLNSENNIKITIPGITMDNYDDEKELFAISEFNIQVNNGPIEIVQSPTVLYISDKFVKSEGLIVNLSDDDTINDIVIDSTKIDDFENESIFTFTQDNTELSTGLQNIINLIDNSDHLGLSTYEEITNKFAELLITAEINTSMQLVHAEMIIKELIYDLNGKKIDFSNEDIPDYEVMRVGKAVLNKPLSISLSFERIAAQLGELDTYAKEDPSIYDELYR